MPKQIIYLTDRPPIEIDSDNWSVASKEHVNEKNKPPYPAWKLVVLYRKDGRVIVYGTYSNTSNLNNPCIVHKGYYLDKTHMSPDFIACKMKVVGQELYLNEVFINKWINKLPPEKIV